MYTNGSLRSSLLLFVLIGVAHGASVLQPALESLFGDPNDSIGQEELLAMLDVAINVPSLKLEGAVKKMPELDEPGAADLAKQLLALGQAGQDCTAEWATILGSFYTSNVANVTTGPPDMFGKRQAFPALRRMALAQLVQAWLTRMHRQLPPDLEPAMELLLRQLYEAHRVVSIRKGIMEYFHISKAGGTSWCHAAKNNGCRSQVYDSAYICQIGQFDDRVRWLNNSFHIRRTGRGARWGTWGRVRRHTNMTTCASRHEFAAMMGYQYFSNEYTLHEGFDDPASVGLCPQFYNVILIREPLKRLLSHLKFVTMQMKWDYRNVSLFHSAFHGTDSAFWEQLGPVLVDNYMLRGMLGEVVYHAPIGSIGDPQVAHGRALLQQYDLIVDLDAGHDVVDDMMKLGVGWPHTLREIHDKDSAKAAARLNLTYEDYLPTDLERLYAKQGPDTEFYRFGRVLVRLDALLFRVARALAVRPLAAFDLEALRGQPEALRCGLLRRGPRLANSTEPAWQPNDFQRRVNEEMQAVRLAAAARFARLQAAKQAKLAAKTGGRRAALQAGSAGGAAAEAGAAEAAAGQAQGWQAAGRVLRSLPGMAAREVPLARMRQRRRQR